MNYKLSLATLAIASVVSGQALAALTAEENTALAALAPVSTWTAANWGPGGAVSTTSLDGTALINTTEWTDGVDECTWRGVLCDAGNITHIEIPNSGMSANMDAVLAALAPVASTLLVLNVSTTATPANVHAGDMSALSDFTALTHLALNGSSVAGVIPDMSGSTSLNFVNVFNNPGITGFTGKLAGGSAITVLGTSDNPNMSGDMTSTLANLVVPQTGSTVNLNNSNVYGTVELVAGQAMALANTDIIPTGDEGAIAASNFDAALVVQPASGVTVTPGEETASVSWVEPAEGVQTGYSVSLSSDSGATLEGTQVVATGITTVSFDNIDADTYVAVVQSTLAADGRAAAPALSASFDVTAGPLVCEAGEELNATGDACVAIEEEEEEEETTSSGGGGAAFWLILLPLMGLLRRKSA